MIVIPNDGNDDADEKIVIKKEYIEEEENIKTNFIGALYPKNFVVFNKRQTNHM